MKVNEVKIDNSKFKFSMDIQTMIYVFGGECFKFIRPMTFISDYNSHWNDSTGCLLYYSDHLKTTFEVDREISMFFSDPEINPNEYHIYFMAVKNITGSGYFYHPSWQNYGICISRSEDEAITMFPYDIKFPVWKQITPQVVVIGEIELSDNTWDNIYKERDELKKSIKNGTIDIPLFVKKRMDDGEEIF